MKEGLEMQNIQIVKSLIQELPVTKRIKMILIWNGTSKTLTIGNYFQTNYKVSFNKELRIK